jgi:hypothetical protein
MSIPKTWRAQQTSSTAGTGTLTLNAAPANRIGFAASAGAVSQTVHYALSVANTNQWEIGTGVFNGASPGTLTRVTVLASSNAGSLVSFSGTIDVILADPPGQRPRATFTGSATDVVADLGNIMTFTGSTNATRTLPALALVPLGAGYLYTNAGTSGATLTLDASGSETINGATTLTLMQGESVEIFASATGWFATGLPPLSLVRRQVANASATIDFVLPSGFSQFELDFFDVVPATDAAIMSLRTSADSGATFADGASDYNSTSLTTRTGTNSVRSDNVTSTAIVLGPTLDRVNTAISSTGRARIYVGNGSRWPNAVASGSCLDDGNSALLSMWQSGGHRANVTQINAIRLLMSTGNIASGTFSLYAVR